TMLRSNSGHRCDRASYAAHQRRGTLPKWPAPRGPGDLPAGPHPPPRTPPRSSRRSRDLAHASRESPATPRSRRDAPAQSFRRCCGCKSAIASTPDRLHHAPWLASFACGSDRVKALRHTTVTSLRLRPATSSSLESELALVSIQVLPREKRSAPPRRV